MEPRLSFSLDPSLTNLMDITNMDPFVGKFDINSWLGAPMSHICINEIDGSSHIYI